MPTLTVKTKYINRLKKIGVYDKWETNVKWQWNKIQTDYPRMFKVLNNASSFNELIVNSFVWSETIEGTEYWKGVASDYDKEENPFIGF